MPHDARIGRVLHRSVAGGALLGLGESLNELPLLPCEPVLIPLGQLCYQRASFGPF